MQGGSVSVQYCLICQQRFCLSHHHLHISSQILPESENFSFFSREWDTVPYLITAGFLNMKLIMGHSESIKRSFKLIDLSCSKTREPHCGRCPQRLAELPLIKSLFFPDGLVSFWSYVPARRIENTNRSRQL